MRSKIQPCLFFGALYLTSCSTPQTRSEEKAAEFQKLPQAMQQTALKGEVVKGMSQSTVYVALGNPTRIEKDDKTGRETWIYSEIRRQQIPHWNDVQQQLPQGNMITYRAYDPIVITEIKDSFEIVFEKGEVVSWRSLATKNTS